jgi:hypothetical protein
MPLRTPALAYRKSRSFSSDMAKSTTLEVHPASFTAYANFSAHKTMLPNNGLQTSAATGATIGPWLRASSLEPAFFPRFQVDLHQRAPVFFPLFQKHGMCREQDGICAPKMPILHTTKRKPKQ